MTDQRSTTVLGAVGRFFFSPNDPTALGFMRLIAGLVILYNHAAYTPDLREFFGPDAWWDQQAGNYQRRTQPYQSTPLGWELVAPTVQVEDVPHRRSAVVEYLRSLPLDPAERKVKIGRAHV